jgi:hypothetical protein
MDARIWGRVVLTFAIVFSNSCTLSEPRIKPEPVLYIPSAPEITSTEVEVPVGTATSPFTITRECMQRKPCLTRMWDSLTGVNSTDCVYAAFKEDTVDSALMSQNPNIVSNTITQVLDLSDENCAMWDARVFAFRTGSGFAGGFIQQVLSTGGAVAGLLSGPAAAGVSAANAGVGAFTTGINTTYYANKAMDQIDSDIRTNRQQAKANINARLPVAPTPTAAPSPISASSGSATATATSTPVPKYSGLDAKSDLIAYDNLCSLQAIATSSASATSTPTATSTPSPTPTATPTPKPHGGGKGAARNNKHPKG